MNLDSLRSRLIINPTPFSLQPALKLETEDSTKGWLVLRSSEMKEAYEFEVIIRGVAINDVKGKKIYICYLIKKPNVLIYQTDLIFVVRQNRFD